VRRYAAHAHVPFIRHVPVLHRGSACGGTACCMRALRAPRSSAARRSATV